MRRIIHLTTITSLLLLLAAGTALAWGYNYVKPAEMKEWLTSGRDLLIVDIQPAPAFARQHLPGAMETNAYPVKSDEDRRRLDKAIAAYRQRPRPVVVVCPRGKGGAKRCYTYLKENGVGEDHLFILKGGMDNWPFPELATAD